LESSPESSRLDLEAFFVKQSERSLIGLFLHELSELPVRLQLCGAISMTEAPKYEC